MSSGTIFIFCILLVACMGWNACFIS